MEVRFIPVAYGFSFKPAGHFARKRVNCAESYSPFACVCVPHHTPLYSKNFAENGDFSGVELGSRVPPLRTLVLADRPSTRGLRV